MGEVGIPVIIQIVGLRVMEVWGESVDEGVNTVAVVVAEVDDSIFISRKKQVV